MNIVDIDVPTGANIEDAICFMCADARRMGLTLRANLNKVIVQVNDKSNPELIIRDFWRSDSRGTSRFVVGPEAAEVLSKEELALDQFYKDLLDARRQAFFAEMAWEDAERQTALQAALEKAPAFTFSSPEAQARFEAALARIDPNDGYSMRPFTYALEVGRLVQAKPGRPSLETLKAAMDLADDGLSGAMANAALGILRDCWVHGALAGKLLRRS